MSKSIITLIITCIIICHFTSTAVSFTTTTTTTPIITTYEDPEQPHHNCTEWISNVFGDCVTNRLEMSGFWMGVVSIMFWILAQFPQIVQNIRRQDAGALSGLFLFMFLLADVIDIIGTIFIYAVGTQLYASIFYILMDITLLLQWLYYKGKTTLKERKFKRQYSTAAVNNILNNYSDTHGGRSTYFSPVSSNKGRLTSSSADLLGARMSSAAAGTEGILSTTHHPTASNFGYAYYQSRPQPPPTRNFQNENDSSVFSVYSETDSEVLAAYDTQEEDNLYQQARSGVPNPRDNNPSLSQMTPSRFSFLKEQTFTNSPRDSKMRLSAVIFLPLILCSILLYTFVVQQHAPTTTFNNQSDTLIRVRGFNSRSLLQFGQGVSADSYKQEIMNGNGQIDGRGSLWPVSDGLGMGGYVLGWIAASIATLSRFPQIFRNWSRKSTDGLSVFMFLLTILGNFTLCLSLFLIAAGSDFILAKLPWIIGGITSIILDAVIVLQCWLYYEKRYINIYDDEASSLCEE